MPVSKTIYLVDDDEDDLWLMQDAISELGLDIEVRIASNGQELLEILDKSVNQTLILMDVNMPLMNGIETLNAIYADPANKHIRSILISTSDSAELETLALNSGAMKFIPKPLHYKGLLQLMNDIYCKCF